MASVLLTDSVVPEGRSTLMNRTRAACAGRTGLIAAVLLLAAALSPAALAQPYGASSCAPDCYVSPGGNDQTGDGTIGSPWKTLVKCFNEVGPGDTCWLREGTHVCPTSSSTPGGTQNGCDLGGPCANGLNASPYYCTRDRQSGGTSTAPKKIRGYSGEAAVIRPEDTTQSDTIHLRGNAGNMLFSDLEIQGRLNTQTDGVELTRIVFRCPGPFPTGVDNQSSIYVHGSDVHVHDNLFIIEDSCPGTYAGSRENMNFTRIFDVTGLVVENNDFLNLSTEIGLQTMQGLKWPQFRNSTVRYNYHYTDPAAVDTVKGIWIGGDGPSYSPQNNKVYQNVLVDANIEISTQTNNYDIYNNTIAMLERGDPCIWATGSDRPLVDHEFFNNICYFGGGLTQKKSQWAPYSTDTYGIEEQQLVDYNLFYGAREFENKDSLYSSLSAYQQAGYERNSSEGDPLFVDAAAHDFRLQSGSPARSGGRGGSFPAVRGAYVSGDEVIGCTFDPRCHGAGGTPSPGTGGPDPACSDGLDNDGDGAVDLADYGCSRSSDETETSQTQCGDGVDNDGDGVADQQDPDCTGPADDDESASAPVAGGLECDGWRSAHPEWIWCDDFEADASLEQDYFDVSRAGGRLAVVGDEAFGGSASLSMTYEPGVSDAGNVKRGFGRSPVRCQGDCSEDFDEVYWRFYMKMPSGWEGQPKKTTRATVFADSSWSQAMIAHVWEGNTLNLKIDPARGVEGAQVVTTGWNDFNNLVWPGGRDGTTEVYSADEIGTWRCVEAHVRLNTPAQSDGVFELWLDGNLEASRNDLNWRGSWTGYGLNMIMLEGWWSESPKVQSRYMDNFVISRERVGCRQDDPLRVRNLRRTDTRR
jgi:hypothetical protein